jgi:uncharacterized metal-binding protein YceD (DUF177 family)
MNEGLPFSHVYNLNRLGQAGDEVRLELAEAERAALARFAGVLRIDTFQATAALAKLSADRFRVEFALDSDLVQACVVTLVELPSHIQCRFARELHFSAVLKREGVVDVPLDDDMPEEIDSLHYDLAAPLIEEFILAIDPYPRAQGVEFQPSAAGNPPPESPFAVLKGLKSGR